MSFHKVTPHPFIKWVGGKRQLLPELRKRYETALSMGCTKYAEPFVGGGAVLFDIISAHNFEDIYISDINAELINVYNTIRDNVGILIDELSNMQNLYVPLDNKMRSQFYYNMRDEYNHTIMGTNKDNVRKAVLMMFLNRTCFNGLYRVNSKGYFNVPIGSYKNPKICDSDNLVAVSKALRDVRIANGQFSDSEHFIDNNTLVYFDPPYRPLNTTSKFTSYTDSGFNDNEQMRLARYVDQITFKGAKVMLSNSDPGDDFFDKLYKKYKVERVSASRAINSNAKARGKISEILIINYG